MTNERLAGHGSPNPALMRGCSPEAGAGGVRGTSGASRSSGCFRDCLDQNLSCPGCLWISLLPPSPPHSSVTNSPKLTAPPPPRDSASEPRGRQLPPGLCGEWEGGPVMRGDSEQSGQDSNRWCVAQEGPGWPWNSSEDGRSHLLGRCVTLPGGHFPLQPSRVCLFITLGLTLAAALGGTFFWPEVIRSLPSHFAEGETESHRGALVCLSWDPCLVHAG